MKHGATVSWIGAMAWMLVWIAASDVCVAQEQPPTLPGGPIQERIKYEFVNGKKWGNPRVGYCCRSKWDFDGTTNRWPWQIKESLLVYGGQGDIVIVFQRDFSQKFSLWPPNVFLPFQIRAIGAKGYATFPCTGWTHGFVDEPGPLKIVVKKKNDGIVREYVKAGGTFGLRAQFDPEKWGVQALEEKYELQSYASGAPKVETYSIEHQQWVGMYGGCSEVGIETVPDDLSASLYLDEKPVKARWQTGARMWMLLEYQVATPDAESFVSVGAKWRFECDFPDFPEAVQSDTWNFSEYIDGPGHAPLQWYTLTYVNPSSWIGTISPDAGTWDLNKSKSAAVRCTELSLMVRGVVEVTEIGEDGEPTTVDKLTEIKLTSEGLETVPPKNPVWALLKVEYPF